MEWFSVHSGWLIIYDNVKDIALVKSFLPSARQGSILFTTRIQCFGVIAPSIELREMPLEEGIEFLLNRSKYIIPGQSSHDTSSNKYISAKRIVEFVGSHPLAIDQIGAYIENYGYSLPVCFERMQKNLSIFFDIRGSSDSDYPMSFTNTLTSLIKNMKEMFIFSYNLLYFCVFLPPLSLSEELLLSIFASNYIFDDYSHMKRIYYISFTMLRNLSIIYMNDNACTISLHPFVRIILQDLMSKEEQGIWKEKAFDNQI